MKTTGGKTKPAPKQERKIFLFSGGMCLGHLYAVSLNKALRMYYRDYVKPRGRVMPLITGNLLTIYVDGAPGCTGHVVALYESDIRT